VLRDQLALGILPNFTGISINDGWFSYFFYDCQHAACLVYVLRELVFLAEEQRARWAADMKEVLLDMKQATDQARDQGKPWLDPLEVILRPVEFQTLVTRRGAYARSNTSLTTFHCRETFSSNISTNKGCKTSTESAEKSDFWDHHILLHHFPKAI